MCHHYVYVCPLGLKKPTSSWIDFLGGLREHTPTQDVPKIADVCSPECFRPANLVRSSLGGAVSCGWIDAAVAGALLAQVRLRKVKSHDR
jgi:hypothetical protein